MHAPNQRITRSLAALGGAALIITAMWALWPGTSGGASVSATSAGPSGVAYNQPGTYSYTVPAEANRLLLDVVGGGGGGGGGAGSEAAPGPGGGGGGSGGSLIDAILPVTPGDVCSVTVGAGGAGGAAQEGAGVDGAKSEVSCSNGEYVFAGKGSGGGPGRIVSGNNVGGSAGAAGGYGTPGTAGCRIECAGTGGSNDAEALAGAGGGGGVGSTDTTSAAAGKAGKNGDVVVVPLG